MGTKAANHAWAQLVGLSVLQGVQVIVDSKSPLAPRGWIGILALDGTITASVPRADLAGPVNAALVDLSSRQATMSDVVVPRLPPTRAALGPASLFYPPNEFSVGGFGAVEEVSAADVESLLEAACPEELNESGVRELASPLFGSRSATGALAAVSGYRRWPNKVAHLAVLTHPDHRRGGHGRRVAVAAIRHAMDEHLLPQWRARPVASKMLARSLGLTELGAQLSLEPA